MRIAVIDVGTNSVKLLVADVRGRGSRAVFEDAEITRLGERVAARKRLAKRAMIRTAKTVARFAGVARAMGAAEVRVVGTAAMRMAANRNEFVRLVRREADVEITILSGEEEAIRSFAGGTSRLSLKKKILLVDIGGGSTELVLGRHGRVVRRQSIPFGAVTLTEGFLRHDPPSDFEVVRLLAHVARRLVGSRILVEGLKGRGIELVVVGGTAATLGRILGAAHGGRVGRTDLMGLFAGLRAMKTSTRVRRFGMPKGRADIIVAGAALLLAVMAACGAEKIVISRRGLRHGMLAAHPETDPSRDRRARFTSLERD
ncbi:MAG: hypothetical protein RDV41_05210 [Planctomycetota bacterium]|nr:hypothetical protein [Planctomycetota bacterium]